MKGHLLVYGNATSYFAYSVTWPNTIVWTAAAKAAPGNGCCGDGCLCGDGCSRGTQMNHVACVSRCDRELHLEVGAANTDTSEGQTVDPKEVSTCHCQEERW